MLVGVIIIQLFPRESAFNYKYSIGKPWTDELITASFDFPIYKSEEQIYQEREELMKNYVPYYEVDTTAHTVQFERFVTEFQRKNGFQPLLKHYIEQQLKNIYSKGIISSDNKSRLAQKNIQNINCIFPNRYTKLTSVESLQTPKEAYEEFINSTTTTSDKNLLGTYNMHQYLIENIIYDSVRSNQAENEIMKNLSLTMGFIQTGEKIIDRGEIVTPELYNILNSLKKETEKRQDDTIEQSTLSLLGKVIIVLGFITLLFTYFYLFRPQIYAKYGNLILILSLVLFNVVLASLTIYFKSNVIHYYMVPYALLPIVTRVFFDSRTALYAHIVTSTLIAFMVPEPFQFLVLQIAVGMLAVSSLKDLSQRSQLAQTSLYIFLCYSVCYVAFMFISEGNTVHVKWQYFVSFAIGSMLLLLAYIVVYLFEKMFGLISNVTLVELTNINSDLMIKFAETAPGTFQHSLQVSNLATEAAKKIGVNSLLVRTGALYHDIGKMKNPGFFTENQVGGKNPLLEKDHQEAARIIIEHVVDGIKIAKKHHLPDQITNFISTHHGRSKVKYFYNSYINAHPDEKPNDMAFTYPGPNPNSKETAILMMADAVEARSRSLPEYTEKTISDMVEDMIDCQIAEGLFKESPISFQDVETVKQVFKEKLTNIYHTRIVYPTVNKEIESNTKENKQKKEKDKK